MKMNLGEIERLFEKIRDIIDYVEKANLKSRVSCLYLANDEVIKLQVPDSTIAHLLGININYLKSTRLFKSYNSFELLKEIANDPYKIYTQSINGYINQELLFSTHINKKVDSFKENIKLKVDETEFICKYDKERSYCFSDKSENADYIIVKKYEDGSIGVIFLTKSDDLYVPMSNRMYKSFEEAKENLKDVFINQELTLLSGTKSFNLNSDYTHNVVLKPVLKREKFLRLKDYKNIFKANIDVFGDYIYMSNKLLGKREETLENNVTLDEIIKAIIENKLINRNKYIDSPLLPLIDILNDRASGMPLVATNTALSYTEAIKRLQEAKELIITYENENKQLKETIVATNNENNNLKKVNEEQSTIINKVFELTKSKLKEN